MSKEVKMFVWNNGQPEIEILGGDYERDLFPRNSKLEELLEIYDCARQEFYIDGRSGDFHFRAWTDPYRGRCSVSGTTAESAEKMMTEHKEHYAKLRVFTANELYVLTPIRVSYALGDEGLERYLPFDLPDWKMLEHVGTFKRVEIRILASRCLGSDECWKLSTLWFDGQPVAVLKAWYEDDYDYRVTNPEVFFQMIQWIRSFAEVEHSAVLDPDKKDHHLTEFFHSSLQDFYDVDEQKEIRDVQRLPQK